MTHREVEAESARVAVPRDPGVEQAAAAAYEPRTIASPSSATSTSIDTPTQTSTEAPRSTPVVLPKITDLQGRECKIQPGENQTPVLEAGKRTRGCEYQTSTPAELLPFNTAALYRQSIEQNVHFDVSFKNGKASGSGVMIGKGNGECYVATDNHVVNGVGSDRPVARFARTADGSSYPAEVRFGDPKNDVAVVALKTGKDTDKVCRPAQVAENPEATTGTGATIGFPKGSKSLYASPTEFRGAAPLAQLLRERRTMTPPGGVENFNRTVLNLRAQTHEGNSGGPVYNSQGEVVGLLAGGTPADPTFSAANVISRRQVEDWLSRIRR